ncbi:MAG: hypothetical protein ABR543_18260, partial [Gemmatimonadaceae bacterium]
SQQNALWSPSLSGFSVKGQQTGLSVGFILDPEVYTSGDSRLRRSWLIFRSQTDPLLNRGSR